MVAAVGLSITSTLLAQTADQPAGAPATNPAEDQLSRGISGTLLDPSGAAIAKAQVSLLAADDKPRAQATTNNSGGFRFDSIAHGKYTLDIQAEGFRETRIQVSLTSQRPAPIRVTMQIAVPNESITVSTGDSIASISTENSANGRTGSKDQQQSLLRALLASRPRPPRNRHQKRHPCLSRIAKLSIP